MKAIITIVIVIIIVAFGAFYVVQKMQPATNTAPIDTTHVEPLPTDITNGNAAPSLEHPATTTPPAPAPKSAQESIGTSVGGNAITAYHFGTGPTEIVFVGGIHGGYEWNTVLVADELIDYLTQNPSAVPANETVTVIPVLNPDGLKATVGTTGRFTPADVPTAANATVAGRFNGDKVDLNRNFDCDWQATGVWQSTPVSGGTAAFSEPEAKAFQAYVTQHKPAAVVVWFSSAGGVYSSNCHNGILPETSALTKLYADASGYPAHEDWNYYEVTGDVANWLAKINIPAISVLLTNHTDTEWSKNQAGVTAVLNHFAQ